MLLTDLERTEWQSSGSFVFNRVTDKSQAEYSFIKTQVQVIIQKMAALLKRNEMRSVIKNGGVLKKESESVGFDGEAAQEVV